MPPNERGNADRAVATAYQTRRMWNVGFGDAKEFNNDLMYFDLFCRLLKLAKLQSRIAFAKLGRDRYDAWSAWSEYLSRHSCSRSSNRRVRPG